MNFIKMHGIGNDYIYVDCFKESVENPVELAKKISHRRFGVGGDGLILIKPFDKGDGEMEMFNADGSKAEMCGNGIRCVAKYLHDNYAKNKDQLSILTGNGILEAKIKRADDGTAEFITVNMGEPIFNGLEIPTNLDKPKVFDEIITIEGDEYSLSSVSMGNPHCVIYVDTVEKFPVESVGSLIENHEMFPSKVNVEFVQVVSDTELIQRTWERGSGETWACGTGACAVAVVSKIKGICQSEVKVHLKGGDLTIEYDGVGSVLMTGPAVEVYNGVWPD